MRITIFQTKLRVTRLGRRTLYLNLPCNLHFYLLFWFQFTCGLSELQLTLSNPLSAGLLPPLLRFVAVFFLIAEVPWSLLPWAAVSDCDTAFSAAPLSLAGFLPCSSSVDSQGQPKSEFSPDPDIFCLNM